LFVHRSAQLPDGLQSWLSAAEQWLLFKHATHWWRAVSQKGAVWPLIAAQSSFALQPGAHCLLGRQ
jgi:hypothetical protein